LNFEFFRRSRKEIPLKQYYHAISDVLHLLKRVPYRMVKWPMMVIGRDARSPELSLQRLVELLRDDLAPIVFSDDLITKMHDSLPIILFRFGHSEALRSPRVGWPVSFCRSCETRPCHTMMSQQIIGSSGSALRSVMS
jgi:hypothetical protein